MKKYFGKFASSGDVQTALDSGALSKPYVAVVGNEVDYNAVSETDMKYVPLTVEIISDGAFILKANNYMGRKQISYSVNNGNYTTDYSTANGVNINVKSGDTITLIGDNNAYWVGSNWTSFQSTCLYKIKGNLYSLINSTDFANVSALTGDCFRQLFQGSTGLTDASKLVIPDCNLSGANHFKDCFDGCTSLTKGPVLDIKVLSNACYENLFNNCNSLSYVKCLATDISHNYAVSKWLLGASATGTFVKKAGVSWPSGNNGIPNGWTVIEE